jgi:hypothetical protein
MKQEMGHSKADRKGAGAGADRKRRLAEALRRNLAKRKEAAKPKAGKEDDQSP